MALSDIFERLDRWVGYRPESRTLSYAQFWASGGDIRGAYGARTAAGEAVDIETALALPVVLRAFSLMSGDIGPLPIDAFRRVDKRRQELPTPSWLDVPDPANPNFGRPQLISQCVVSLMGDGNLFVRAFPDRYATTFVRVLDPWRVHIETGADGIDRYRIGSALLDSSQVVHVPMLTLPGQSRGKSPISLLAEPIASGLAAIKFGGYFFSNGAAMQGIIEAPAGAQLDAKQIKEEMRRGNGGLTRSHALGVLTGGATFKELTSNPRDSQMVELQDFIVEDVGRAYGIPPFKLGSTQPGAVAYASTSNARVEYGETVANYVTRLEHAFSTLIPGADTFLKFNLNAVMRSNPEARITGYTSLLQNGVITKDEVRAWEDWGPADEAAGVGTKEGDFLRTPNNTSPDDQTATLIEQVKAGLRTENEARQVLDLPPMEWGDDLSAEERAALIEEVKAGLRTENEARELLKLPPMEWSEDLTPDESAMLNDQVKAGLLTENEARELMKRPPMEWAEGPSPDEIASLATQVKEGLLTIEEARELLGRPPVDWPEDLSEKVKQAAELIKAGFHPADVLSKLGLPPIRHTGLPPVTVQKEVDGVSQDIVDPDAVDQRALHIDSLRDRLARLRDVA